MLVLALEFSRAEPARGTHPTTDDLAAERARTGRAAAEPSRAPRRRRRRDDQGSLPQNGRAEARCHDLFDPVTDGLPAGEPRNRGTRLPCGRRGGPPSVVGWS